MIYKFRVILDAEEDIFRDIAIAAKTTFEDLHNSIVQAFGFEGGEMASFYLSDDQWNQGEEISLFETGESRIMEETSLDSLLDESQTRLLYVYDFLNMWTFFVELADIGEAEENEGYPLLLFSHGQLPENAPEKQFEAEESFDEDFDDSDLDPEDYENLGFDENWN